MFLLVVVLRKILENDWEHPSLQKIFKMLFVKLLLVRLAKSSETRVG